MHCLRLRSRLRSDKIVLKKWYTIYKDHITLADYEINDGMSLECVQRHPTKSHS